MLKKVTSWLESKSNLFTVHGCESEVLYSSEDSETNTITVDFEYSNYYCRLIFWESGIGHVEIVDIETEDSLLDQSFDVTEQLEAPKPFDDFLKKIKR